MNTPSDNPEFDPANGPIDPPHADPGSPDADKPAMEAVQHVGADGNRPPSTGTPSPAAEPDGSELREPPITEGEQTRKPLELVPFDAVSRIDSRGPGLIEACCWTAGVLLVHIAGGAFTVFVIAIVVSLLYGNDQARQLFAGGDSPFLAWLVGGEMLIFTCVALLAVSVRLAPNVFRKLGLRGISWIHLLAMLALVWPMSLVSGEIYRVADEFAWRPAVERQPRLESLDQLNTVEAIPGIAAQVPFVALLLMLALAPAISEEVIFRGVIGRGLIARYGWWPGILITTLLFAVIHVHPVHVVGVIPLGLCMHGLYLATRSFWAPVAYHFFNNAWAATLTKYAPRQLEFEASTAVSPVVVASAIVCVAGLIVLLWRTRVRYISPDGEPWPPSRRSLESPPPGSPIRKVRGRMDRSTLLLAGVAVAQFLAVVSWASSAD